MSAKIEIPRLDRVWFFEGQALTADDLADAQATTREQRWLHNRSLHGWGIGVGLHVHGGRWDRQVTVDPGYAVDRHGREVVSTETETLAVPADAGSASGQASVYYVIAAYQKDADQEIVDDRDGACGASGTVRLSDEALLAWRRPEQVREGFDLVLAQAWVRNCRLARPLSATVRRSARPSAHPYVAAGRTPPGETKWHAWMAGGSLLGVKANVDTSVARFQTTPAYSAHVAGERFLRDPPGPLLAVGVSSLVRATARGFTLHMALPRLGDDFLNPPPLHNEKTVVEIARTKLRWHVVWMGVEG